MANDNEPAKLLLPYLQRADELQKHEHLVAYYCRLYAMERGLKIPQKERTKTTNSLLISLMNQLEKDKKSLKLGPEDNLYAEGFALNVFAKADKQDRAGRADLNTAKTFYAASIFFEILNQFGELQPDIEQKQKYSAWKAADIRKALKEGRRPEPGPPGGDKDSMIPSNASSNTYDLGSSESFPASQPGADTPTRLQDKDFSRSASFPASLPDNDMLSRSQDEVIPQPSAKTPTPPSTYVPPDYPSNDLHEPQPPNRPENSAYPQSYHHQSYSYEQPQTLPQNYPSHENSTPPYSYSNYQSYPSFSEESLPTAPTHYSPYYHQGSDAGYSHQSGPPSSNFQSPVQYSSSNVNGTTHTESPPPSTAAAFKYDSNYLPPPEKIAEAHKAARFAVGALAFDDVPVAVDFLRRSLELLTNPSASQ